ncbi:hypothetical protein GCM10023178_74500 [Actinomadura luteofluorescens]
MILPKSSATVVVVSFVGALVVLKWMPGRVAAPPERAAAERRPEKPEKAAV